MTHVIDYVTEKNVAMQTGGTYVMERLTRIVWYWVTLSALLWINCKKLFDGWKGNFLS